MERRAITGILVTLILFTGLIGMLNTPTLAEIIPVTEVFYGDGCQLFEQGIYVIATETDPVEMYPNYTNVDAYYEMLKEHVTTETSGGVFISILVSQGIFPMTGYGLEILSIEKIDYEFVLTATVSFYGTGYYYVTNPIALIPIGDLSADEYTITLYPQDDVGTWTATFICSEWITAIGSRVEMSIENKTTTLGEELSILMVAPAGVFWLPDSQVFDIYLCDSNYSLFSYWSQDKMFAQMITSVPPGYNATLEWNLYHYNPSTGEFTPPPPGYYYLTGAIMEGPADFTPSILIRIDETTITPIAIVVPPEPENLPPIAQFIYSPTFPYIGQVVTFDASGSSDIDGTIVSYSWDFGDGVNATGVTTSHSYADDETYIVTLTVTDIVSLTDTVSSIISVSPSHQHLYILADGSIDPPTANITSLDNVTYTFTGNVRSILYVERDNIVVDGAGYTLQGPGTYDGISLSGRSNVTIRAVKVQGCAYGVYLNHSYNITFFGNEVKDNMWGLFLIESFNNTFYHNNFVDNTVQALSVNSTNIWDNGYEGNYWSNYNGTDLNADGIGDTYLPWETVDFYPLMNPYTWGDVNHDGEIDILDEKLVKLACSKVMEYPYADLDENGVINILDLKVLKLIYSGLLA